MDTLDINTESVKKKRINAAKLDEVGVTFVPRSYDTEVSDKFGEFRIINGELEDGQELDVVFSNKDLHKLVTTHWEQILNRRINLSGTGVGFDRRYRIKSVG